MLFSNLVITMGYGPLPIVDLTDSPMKKPKSKPTTKSVFDPTVDVDLGEDLNDDSAHVRTPPTRRLKRKKRTGNVLSMLKAKNRVEDDDNDDTLKPKKLRSRISAPTRPASARRKRRLVFDSESPPSQAVRSRSRSRSPSPATAVYFREHFRPVGHCVQPHRVVE